MSLSETRFGANAFGLPGLTPLPPLTAALSRRAALFGAVTVAGVTAAPAVGWSAPCALAAVLHPADARLFALADAVEALDRTCNAHTAEHRGRETEASEKAFSGLVDGFDPIEEEIAATPADTMAGVLAKARALQVPTVRQCQVGIGDSVAADLWRLFGSGALS